MYNFWSKALILFVCACASVRLVAQDEEDESRIWESAIYADDISSVTFTIGGNALSLPVFTLDQQMGSVAFEFDLMGTDIKDYVYTILHCDTDWKSSGLQENQYLRGFTEDRILNFETSFNTLEQYVHYDLSLPNNNMGWTVSGNYVLKVYEQTDDGNVLVVTRRFMVTERAWVVGNKFVRPANVRKLYTHQELDFSVNIKDYNIASPSQDVKAFVLQNSRWDNAVGPVVPNRPLHKMLDYDYQDVIVFPAGREFRFFDIRTFQYRRDRVAEIMREKDFLKVTVTRDYDRSEQQFSAIIDANGMFVIDNMDNPGALIECDYASVLFSLETSETFDDKDIYLFGALTDWQLQEKYRLAYNKEAKVYYNEQLLKQGYYNYMYVVRDQKTGKISDSINFEGDFHETENNYTILVYYRPFGARFDRLMAAQTYNSIKG